MIVVRTEDEINKLREAGKVVGLCHKYLQQFLKPGITTKELNDLAKKFIESKGCTCSFEGLYGFPGCICISINDEVVHGKKSLLDKMPGDAWQKFASLRALYAYYMMHPGKKLLFMGSEFGQGLEWRYAYGLEWELLDREPHIKMKEYVKDLNNLYKNEKAVRTTSHSLDYS